MNQLYASGKSIFKSQLKTDLNFQIKEIKLLKELSDEEKNYRIAILKKNYRKEIIQSEFYSF